MDQREKFGAGLLFGGIDILVTLDNVDIDG